MDCLEVKELCFDAHDRGDCTWILLRLHLAIHPMQHSAQEQKTT